MKQAIFSISTALLLSASVFSAPAPKAVPAPTAPPAETTEDPPKKQTLIPPPAMPDRPAAEPPPGVVIPAATPSTPPPVAVPSTPPPAAAKVTAPAVAPAPPSTIPATAAAPVPAVATAPRTTAPPAPATSSAGTATVPGAAPPAGADMAAIQQQMVEVEPPPAETDYIISDGDTLGAIAAKLYGNEAYGAVLTNYNAVDAKKLKIGQTIKTPAIGQMLSESGFAAKFPEESVAFLRVKKTYATEIEPKLNELKGTLKKGDSVPEDLKKQLKDLRTDLEKARQGFIAKCAGLKAPESTLLQFRTASDLLAFLSKGEFGKNDMNIQEVHRRLGLGMAYSIFWARSGFK